MSELTKDRETKRSRAQKDPSVSAYFNRQSHLLDEMKCAHLDIEDLKYAADEHEACTFYVTKELYKNAEFVMCPYNYIFDGAIRAAMDIDLHNAAIIIDEGHNIEDVCREAPQWKSTRKMPTRYLDEIGILVGHFPEALPVKNFLNEISAWISRKMKQRDKFDRYNKTRTLRFKRDNRRVMGRVIQRRRTRDFRFRVKEKSIS